MDSDREHGSQQLADSACLLQALDNGHELEHHGLRAALAMAQA